MEEQIVAVPSTIQVLWPGVRPGSLPEPDHPAARPENGCALWLFFSGSKVRRTLRIHSANLRRRFKCGERVRLTDLSIQGTYTRDVALAVEHRRLNQLFSIDEDQIDSTTLRGLFSGPKANSKKHRQYEVIERGVTEALGDEWNSEIPTLTDRVDRSSVHNAIAMVQGVKPCQRSRLEVPPPTARETTQLKDKDEPQTGVLLGSGRVQRAINGQPREQFRAVLFDLDAVDFVEVFGDGLEAVLLSSHVKLGDEVALTMTGYDRVATDEVSGDSHRSGHGYYRKTWTADVVTAALGEVYDGETRRI